MSASRQHWDPQGTEVDSSGALPQGPDTHGVLCAQDPPPSARQTLPLRAFPFLLRDSVRELIHWSV